MLKIVAISGGSASVDTNGDGAADDATTLNAVGITTVEQQRLATLYTAGQTLWRIPVAHFTPWDFNWPYGPPSDAVAPPAPQPANDPTLDNCNVTCGSSLQVENRVLGEAHLINGTPFRLHYSSDRVLGHTQREHGRGQDQRRVCAREPRANRGEAQRRRNDPDADVRARHESEDHARVGWQRCVRPRLARAAAAQALDDVRLSRHLSTHAAGLQPRVRDPLRHSADGESFASRDCHRAHAGNEARRDRSVRRPHPRPRRLVGQRAPRVRRAFRQDLSRRRLDAVRFLRRRDRCRQGLHRQSVRPHR